MMTALTHHKCHSTKLLIGHKHFDWSFITKLANQKQEFDVLTLLRHPVKRIKSHFYFSQTLDWTKSSPTRNLTLEEYFENVPLMMNTRGIWFDGESSVAWLAGLHTSNGFNQAAQCHVRKKKWVSYEKCVGDT